MKIELQGYFNENTGYSTVTKKYLKAMVLSGHHKIKGTCLKGNFIDRIWSNKEFKPDFTILHQLPSVNPNCDGYICTTEFNYPPTTWWKILNKAKIILTQSDFCVKSFSRIPGMNRNKIHNIGYILGDEFYPGPPGYIFKKKRFIFGSCFEWVERKKPELMWKAFREEFPIEKYPELLFINKISIPNWKPNWKYDFNMLTKQDPRIICYVDKIDNMAKFYNSLDCYISTSAGEGFGATLAEAMACGIPTIGSNHSGNLDFMNKENSYLVEVHDWSYNDDRMWLNGPGLKWKLPKLESIKKQMRRVFKNPDEKNVLEISANIRKKYSVTNTSKKIGEVFENL